MRVVLVSGGVISGVGKGQFSPLPILRVISSAFRRPDRGKVTCGLMWFVDRNYWYDIDPHGLEIVFVKANGSRF